MNTKLEKAMSLSAQIKEFDKELSLCSIDGNSIHVLKKEDFIDLIGDSLIIVERYEGSLLLKAFVGDYAVVYCE